MIVSLLRRVVLCACLLVPLHAIAAENPSDASLPGVIVDKKTNSLYLVEFTDIGVDVKKTFHTTLGLVPGDKFKEGDKKTPEGIYFFEETKRRPNLEKKFGAMALTMNYPNPWDKFQNRTGSGIWFHATDDPGRLVRNFDSLGCVVVKDEEITEIYPQLRTRVSPIVVFEDFARDKEIRSPQRIAELKHFVNTWANAWGGKDIDAYIGMYHSKFRSDGKNLSQWRAHKSQLNKQYDKIMVAVDHIQIFSHPKYDVAIFNQLYESHLANGATAKRAAGVKILYITRENNEPKILSEQIRNTHI